MPLEAARTETVSTATTAKAHDDAANPKTPGEFRSLARSKVDQANQIKSNADSAGKKLTKDDLVQIKALLAEFEDLKNQAEAIEALDEAMVTVTRPGKAKVAASTPDPDLGLGGRGGAGLAAQGRVWADARDKSAEARHGFRAMGEFCQHVWNAGMVQSGGRGPLGPIDERLYFQAAATGMRQAAGADGGFLVPPAFSTAIWDGLNTGAANLLGMTDNYTVEGESLTFPANGETTRVGGSVYGGVTAYWIAEADQITNTKAKLRQMKIEPNQLAALVYVTEKLLKNSPVALDQYVTRAATDAINFQVGNAILRGNGTGQPLGILNSPALVTVTKETGQTSGTFYAENAVKMWARLHPNMRASAVWLINVDVTAQLWKNAGIVVKSMDLSTNVGAAMLPVFNPENYTILGKPIIETEYNSSVGTTGDVCLAAMKAYATGTRGGIDAAVSMHLRFDFAESAFRFIFEVDGQPWLNSPLTPAQGSNTLSSFVVLETR